MISFNIITSKNKNQEDMITNDRTLEKKKDRYISCENLEYGLVAFSDGIRHCCGNQEGELTSVPIMLYDNFFYQNPNQFIERFIEEKKEIIAKMKRGEQTMCTGCKYLKEGEWDRSKRVTKLNLSLDGTCNLKCIYCYKMKDGYHLYEGADVYQVIRKLKECNYVSIESQIIYASGELSIQKNANEIIGELEDYEVAFLTNATHYNKIIHEIIKKKESCIVVSLDSGTRETYQKVKGVDLFDTVCENIEKYAKDGGHIILKYIVMENNTRTEDLNGFIELCKQYGVKNIRVSRNWFEEDINEKIKHVAMQLVLKATRNKIHCFNDGTTICME